MWWYGGWQAPSGVSYVAGSSGSGHGYPLGNIARVERGRVSFLPGSCARTRIGNNTPDTWQWLCSPLFDVWGAAEDDLFAVGNLGNILHFDGESWTPLRAEGWSPPTHDLNAIWGADDGSLFAVGRKGSIVQGDRNGGLAVTDSPVDTDLTAVWGRGPNDVFAVGKGGTILHFDGTRWTAEASGTDLDLSTVWGAGECDIMASSVRGALLRRRAGNGGAKDESIAPNN